MAQANDLARGAGVSAPIGENEQFRAPPAPSTTPHPEKAPFPDGSFTPGPWVARPNPSGNGEWEVVKPDDDKDFADEPWFIAACFDDADGASAEANARLTAAAPDMFEALKAAKAFHDRDSGLPRHREGRSMSNHTAGPWKAVKAAHGPIDILDSRGRDIVTFYGGGVEGESKAANAQITAAAPDMFEALEGIVHFSDAVAYRDDALSRSLREWIEAGRVALEKAKTGASS
jgi:hypothetical protein